MNGFSVIGNIIYLIGDVTQNQKIVRSSKSVEAGIILIPCGTLGSTLGLSVSRTVLMKTNIPTKVRSQLVGHLLGDAHVVFPQRSRSPYFEFVQRQ